MENIAPNDNPVIPANYPPARPSQLPIVILSVLVVICLVGMGFMYWQNQQLVNKFNNISINQSKISLEANTTPSPSIALNSVTVSPVLSNWKKYADKNKVYSFKYPPEYTVEEPCTKLGFTTKDLCIYSKNYRAVYAPVTPGVGGNTKEIVDHTGVLLQVSLPDQNIPYTEGYCQPGGPVSVSDCHEVTINNQAYAVRKFGNPVNSQEYAYLEKNMIKAFMKLNFPVSDSINSEQLVHQIISTFQFISQQSIVPTNTIASSAKRISYVLPSGWQTTTDKGGNFQIGYNPATQILNSYDSGNPAELLITTKNLNNNKYYAPYAATIITGMRSYTGGSRHTFIETELLKETLSNQNKSASYHEKEYVVQGKNCLVLYGISISMSPTTWGMCPVSSTRAFYFNGFSDEATVEQVLGTVKFLQ